MMSCGSDNRRSGPRFALWPLTRDDALAFVSKHHRHLGRPVGHKFALGAGSESRLVGVLIAGRPVARHNDDGLTIEFIRVATDGTKNACSFLYGAGCRAARALGYARALTYIREDEPGTSLRAAGFKETGLTRIEQWHRDRRPRERGELIAKRRWERAL